MPEPGSPSPRDIAANHAHTATTIVAAAHPALTPPPGDSAVALTKLGNYTLKRLIGSGGMGSVYEAEQENPRRIVALKVMRSAISSPAALRRFEYESQLLARLRHSGIAQIYEAGTHTNPSLIAGAPAEPIPYYAMEYIPDARTLTDYAKARRTTIAEKLTLFAKVCDAVHHGHSKGIIHRDLKPANILVDAAGEPKIIDFGVARSGDQDLPGATMQTQPGVLIGTLQYMSPEQVAADPSAIDTRSDVYALGVVLYELLAGRLPYDLSRASIHEATHLIREQPATRLSAATGESGAGIRGDVETIVMKALEKGPERRYQSAADLAADIRRYLQREPIAARPPSVSYQLRVIARRNKTLAVALVLVAASLVGATAVSVRFALSEKRQRAAAILAGDQAKSERDRAMRVTDFLKEMLATADPTKSGGKKATVRELLDIASARIPEAFKDDPSIGASVRISLGQTYMQLGDLDKALAEFRTAHATWEKTLGPENPETLNSLAQIGSTLELQGKANEAEKPLTQALEAQKRIVGPEHADTLASMSNLALVLQDQGKLAESEKLQRETLAIKQRVLGPMHAETVTSLNNLSDLLHSQGRLDEAVRLSQDTARTTENLFGPKHPTALMAAAIYGSALQEASRHKEAEAVLRKTLETRIDILGKKHAETITSMNTLALNEQSLANYASAQALFREAIALARETLGPEAPATLTYMNNLANMLRQASSKLPNPATALDEAEALFTQLLEIRRRTDGPGAVSTLSVLNNYALLLEERNKFEQAEPLFREVVSGVDAALPADHWMRSAARKNLGDCLVDQSKFTEAETILKNAYEESNRVLGRDHQRTRSCATSLERLYTRLNRPEDAAKWTPLTKATSEK